MSLSIPNFLQRVLSRGAEHYDEPLQKLRVRTLNASCILFVVLLLVISLERLREGSPVNAAIDAGAAFAVLIAVLILRKRNFNLLAFIVGMTAASLSFALSYAGLVDEARTVPQITLCMVSFIIVMTRQAFRIVYVVICVAFYVILSLKLDGNIIRTLIPTFQLLAFAVVFFYFIHFFEAQDTKIRDSLEDLKASNAEKEAAIGELNERNEELVVFSHIMSHDLKSPLTAIRGYADLLELDYSEGTMNEETQESIEAISSTAESMNTLIIDMLTYSKISLAESHIEMVNLNEVIRNVVKLFEYQKTHGNASIKAEPLLPLLGNKDMFRTVFQNLISNAIKYQPKDIPGHHARVRIWSEKAQENVHIFIEDNGIGIAKEYLPHLFKPFKRFHGESYDGTGLGMSICQSIAEKFNGTIEVKETGASGTTFQLTFPLTSAASTTRIPLLDLPATEAPAKPTRNTEAISPDE